MSIESLANAAAARRPDFQPPGRTPQSISEIAAAAAVLPRGVQASATTLPPSQSVQQPAPPAAGAAAVDSATHVLFGYIPTEVLTLYVAVVAALTTAQGKVSSADWWTFWVFLVGTPAVFWMVFAAKLKSVGKPLPLKPNTWPVWEMFASTVAFAAWAFALPRSPFGELTWYSASVSAIAVLVVSTGLGLLAPFLQKPLAT